MYDVIGVVGVDYTSKKTGQQVRGYRFAVAFPDTRCVVGRDCDSIFIGLPIIEACGGVVPNEGDKIEIVYNKYGRVMSYRIIDNAK